MPGGDRRAFSFVAADCSLERCRYVSALQRSPAPASETERRAHAVHHVLYRERREDHAKEVKLFRLGPALLARYRDLAERIFRENTSLAMRRATCIPAQAVDPVEPPTRSPSSRASRRTRRCASSSSAACQCAPISD